MMNLTIQCDGDERVIDVDEDTTLGDVESQIIEAFPLMSAKLRSTSICLHLLSVSRLLTL